MALPAKEEFLQQITMGRIVPIWDEMLADTETPISIYQKVCRGEGRFLLETGDGKGAMARYSMMGHRPLMIIRSHREKGIEIIKTGEHRFLDGDVITNLKKLIMDLTFDDFPAVPSFFGGAVGYLSYDFIRHIEAIPDLKPDDLGIPEFWFVVNREILIYDHLYHKLIIAVLVEGEKADEKAYDAAVARIAEIKGLLNRPWAGENPSRGRISDKADRGELRSNLSKEEFMRQITTAKEYIRAGDILQVVLSQRLSTGLMGDALDVYRVLRQINPSPYMFLLEFGEVQLCGASPEMLVRVNGRVVRTRPIAGTRPRGKTAQDDQRLASELQQDVKERAEHLMLVDLGRNDIGRVAAYGSVKVNSFMEVEYFSHVMHLVSDVEGVLREELHPIDALFSCFPAGTVSGAPKVRAMEIIEELEPVHRGPYAGAVGYFSFNGNLDFCITIRTIVIKGDTAYVQAGAGIVADSDPEREYQETLNKAMALVTAVNRVEEVR